MTVVFLLQHTIVRDGVRNRKSLGVFTSRAGAIDFANRVKKSPGFPTQEVTSKYMKRSLALRTCNLASTVTGPST
jgi:hypothetical protein